MRGGRRSNRVAIIGVGLMGGSLGMALRRKGWRVTGVGRDAGRLKKAWTLGALNDFTTDLARGVRDADVVVLAVPVGDIVPLAKKAWPHLKPGALVTDVGSVKGPIVRALAGRRPEGGPVFVGAHPMCGSEKAGVEHARADLYRGAPCVLTPAAATPRTALAAAERFWRQAGAAPLRLDPDEHDRRVALVSHLPHLLAEALVLAVDGAGGRAWASRLAAGSFRDAARVAGADPGLWAQIFALNRPAVRIAARGFQKALTRLLREGPSVALLRRAGKAHSIFSKGNPS